MTPRDDPPPTLIRRLREGDIGRGPTVAYIGAWHISIRPAVNPGRGGASMTTRMAADIGELPNWDLGDLYPAPDAASLERDLTMAAAEAARFCERYQGRVGALDGAALAEAIADYERQQDLLGRVGSYAGLLHAGDMEDPLIGVFFQGIQERTNAIGSELLFFTLELNK